MVATLLLGCAPAQAQQGDPYCKGEPGNRTIPFEVAPALVVHDGGLSNTNDPFSELEGGILDVTFAEAGLTNPHGPDTDRLFSFEHTLGAILDSAGVANGPEDAGVRERFLATLIRSLDNDEGLLLNPSSGVLVPVEDRNIPAETIGEGSLTAPALLGRPSSVPASAQSIAVRPLALFNRFDLAPADWFHCGEYRIVYAIPNGGRERRLLFIFEAVMPNPLFAEGKIKESRKGCEPIAKLWAGLATDHPTAVEKAKRLHELYYIGIKNVTAKLSAPNNSIDPDPLDPIISYENLGGGITGRGQVRANLFFQGGWQLREWLTQVSKGPAVAFVPDTVKDNPTAELYLDDISETAFARSNIKGTAEALQRDFVEEFITKAPNGLFVERSPVFQEHVRRLSEFTQPGVDENQLLLALMALGTSDRFNEFQSVSNPVTQSDLDEPSRLAGPNFRRTVEFMFRTPNVQEPNVPAGLSQQQLEIMLNRAEASTCAGCHQTSPRDGLTLNPAMVRIITNEQVVRWPDVAGGFVHVAENRALSPALTDAFLPARRYMLGRFLCGDLPEREAGPAEIAAMSERPDPAALGLLAKSFAPENTGIQTFAIAMDRLEELAVTELVEASREQIMQARRIEQAIPGAFVEKRRPH